ncbi:hypothetical protein PAPYR_6257 [Paratrimastix pyriformis]|uniref:Uncharacterized protein n=1 Tax=Paratrimastix pyriformis TaxID=342808 RepID=A0ABQ8UI83_9EUKA|nr:hypothetical protein PAPYR_6257 [Paratrimastix pyriformis]
MRCPRLRTLVLPAECLDGVDYALPNLKVFAPDRRLMREAPVLNPAWLLAGSPRLRSLSGVCLTRRDLLARLGACGSLVRMEDLHLDVTRLPNPLTLRLSGQVEFLDLHIERRDRSRAGRRTLDLHVEAPGLMNLFLENDAELPFTRIRIRLGNCPALVHLDVRSEIPISLQVDEGGCTALQPRWLYAECLEGASMLDLLAGHGARLHTIAVSPQAVDDWPKLMEALSRLPRLTDLDLDVTGSTCDISLNCPQLQSLGLAGVHAGAKAVLACPLLKELRGIAYPSRQLELAMPAPNLAPPSSPTIDNELLDAEEDE